VLLVSPQANKPGRRSQRSGWLWLVVPLLLGVGCRCHDEAPASIPPSSAALVDCHRDGAELVVSSGAGVSEPDTGGRDSETELPFAVEPGVALEHEGLFFVTALRHESRAAVALLARLSAEPGSSTTPELTELATLRGEPPPPKLTTSGEDVVVGMFEAHAAGYQIRFARLSRSDRGAPLVWWDGPSASREAKGFELAATGDRVLAVWDDWSAREKLGRIFVALVPARAGAKQAPAPAAANVAQGELAVPRAISAASDDVEEPRVAVRPGGYWVAWLVNTGSGAHARVYDPGEAETEAKSASASGTGGRAIVVLALDSAGHAVGPPRRVTNARERVVGYDLTSDAAGTAWIAWRQGAASAGASSGRISVAALVPDQPPRSLVVRQDEVGSGEPSWVGQSTAGSSWLTFPDQRDRSVLSSIAERASVLAASAPLALGPELEGAAVLAGFGERVLFAEPRGRALRLAVARCSLAAAMVSAAATPSAAAASTQSDAGPQP
jgi:hypothetical protein